jgi:hypothetical protein
VGKLGNVVAWKLRDVVSGVDKLLGDIAGYDTNIATTISGIVSIIEKTLNLTSLCC